MFWTFCNYTSESKTTICIEIFGGEKYVSLRPRTKNSVWPINSHFQFNKIKTFNSIQIVKWHNKHPPHVPLATDSVLESLHISVQDVKDVIENLDPKKACGPGHINPRFLKEGASLLSLRGWVRKFYHRHRCY